VFRSQFLTHKFHTLAGPQPLTASKAAQVQQQPLEVGAFYSTATAPDIVDPGREEQGSVSV